MSFLCFVLVLWMNYPENRKLELEKLRLLPSVWNWTSTYFSILNNRCTIRPEGWESKFELWTIPWKSWSKFLNFWSNFLNFWSKFLNFWSKFSKFRTKFLNLIETFRSYSSAVIAQLNHFEIFFSLNFSRFFASQIQKEL
jgi:hypothetical protein